LTSKLFMMQTLSYDECACISYCVLTKFCGDFHK